MATFPNGKYILVVLYFFAILYPPMNPVCQSAACYLAQQGSKITLPLITLAGLVDGINPCAIGMLLMLLGYIIVFAGKPEKTIRIGGVYIAAVYFTYLLIGFLFYQSVSTINFTPYKVFFEKTVGAILLIAGLINLKDFFLPGFGPSLGISEKASPYLVRLIEHVSYPSTIALAFLVTLLETPCSLPIYVGTATILTNSGLPFLAIVGYFAYYNFLFVLPLIILLFLVWQGKKIVGLKEWQHSASRWMRLSLGILLVVMAAWLIT